MRLILSGLLIGGVCGCAKDKTDRERIDEVSGPALADPIQPLSQAFELLNLNPRKLFRYKHFQADYTLTGRLPFIDQVSQSPGHLYGQIDDLSVRMQPKTVDSLSIPLHQIALALNPDFKYQRPPAVQPTGTDSIEAAYQYLLSLYGMQIDPPD